MAQPQEKASGQTGTVASCAATDCRHNENRNCTAEAVKVTVKGGQPVCGTYAPETPKARP